MTKFVKSVYGHVSLAESGKYLPEGQVFPFTDEEAEMDEVKSFTRLNYIIVADTRKEAEDFKFTPAHLQPFISKPCNAMHFHNQEQSKNESIEVTNGDEQVKQKEVIKEEEAIIEDVAKEEITEEDEDEDPITKESTPPKKIRIIMPEKKQPRR